MTSNGTPTGSGTKFGLTLSSEEHGPRRLVEIAALAERSGFDFVSISDHFHPWLDEQGHSPFVWSVLGAIAERTEQIGVAVGVTCPTMRTHPAIVAHATATCAALLEGRFTWGVGTGEALNEHIFGDRWPPAGQRLEQLEEAISVVRQLWTGDLVNHVGRHYRVEDARLYDPPPARVPIVVSAFGPRASELAARIGDGLWTGADAAIIDRWKSNGGAGPVYSQLTLCWATDKDSAVKEAHHRWRNTCVPGQLSQDLPTPSHFAQATSIVSREMVEEAMPCGPDVGQIVEQVRQAVDAGVDHVYFHQVGADQEGFVDLWRNELSAAVAELR